MVLLLSRSCRDGTATTFGCSAVGFIMGVFVHALTTMPFLSGLTRPGVLVLGSDDVHYRLALTSPLLVCSELDETL